MNSAKRKDKTAHTTCLFWWVLSQQSNFCRKKNLPLCQRLFFIATLYLYVCVVFRHFSVAHFFHSLHNASFQYTVHTMFHNLSLWNALLVIFFFSALDSAYIDSNYLHEHCTFHVCVCLDVARMLLFSKSIDQMQIFDAFFAFLEIQNLLACCLKCQRLRCLRCAICIWFVHRAHICICIRNHAQKYREPFPSWLVGFDLFLSAKPFAFECGLLCFRWEIRIERTEKAEKTRLRCSKMSIFSFNSVERYTMQW